MYSSGGDGKEGPSECHRAGPWGGTPLEMVSDNMGGLFESQSQPVPDLPRREVLHDTPALFLSLELGGS